MSFYYFLHLVNHPQLAQLEVAIREHKQEMARKVESLQQSLEAKEKELRQVQQELTDKKLKVGRGHTHSFLWPVTQMHMSTVLEYLLVCN